MSKIKIIAADDETIILSIIKMILEPSGFEVTTCGSGRECLNLLEKSSYDLVLLDIMMPEMDGYELCKIIREKYKDTLVIFLTGSTDDESIKKSFEVGGFDYIEKPVHKLELIARIKNAVRVKDAEDKLRAAMHELSMKNEILERIAITDGLTQLYNHRYTTEQLAMRCEEAKRYSLPLSIIMLDVDHFKNINDFYGHLFGDEVLIAVSDVFRKNLRKSDIPGRYGGEEFLIVLPNTTLYGAINVAENLREKVETIIFNTKDNFNITISAGVACVSNKFNPTDLIRKADKLLYKAKANGRNRIEYSLT